MLRAVLVGMLRGSEPELEPRAGVWQPRMRPGSISEALTPGRPFLAQDRHHEFVLEPTSDPGVLADPALVDEPRLPVRPHRPIVLRQRVKADTVHVQVLEGVVQERSDGVLPEALPPNSHGRSRCRARTTGLSDRFRGGRTIRSARHLHLDSEVSVILPRVRGVLVEVRLELGE